MAARGRREQNALVVHFPSCQRLRIRCTVLPTRQGAPHMATETFILDTSGRVAGDIDGLAVWYEFDDLTPFAQGYVADHLEGLNLLNGLSLGFRDLASETLQSMISDCDAFAGGARAAVLQRQQRGPQILNPARRWDLREHRVSLPTALHGRRRQGSPHRGRLAMRHETPKPAEATAFRFKCVECKRPSRLCELDDEMKCEACGVPFVDPESFGPSEAELRKYERTY
jgi:hypothetical protein